MVTKANLIVFAALAMTAGLVLQASEQLQSYSSIDGHGAVVRLSNAADQPRDDSRICVDLTKGGPVGKINPAIEKVARFVNTYSGAGKAPATVQISVILHGDATLVALSDTAYAERFNTVGNPNLALVRQQFPAQGAAWTQTGRRGNLGQPTENKDESQFLLSDPLPWEDADVYEGQLGATLY